MAKASSLASLASLTTASGLTSYFGVNYFYNSKIKKANDVDRTEEPQNVLGFTLSDIDTDDYRDKLISLFKTDNLSKIVKNHKDNKDWWNWSFKVAYKNKDNKNLDTLFSNLNEGYSEEAAVKSLNNACNEAYKQVKDRYSFDNSFLLQNISDYCTIGDAEVLEPKSVTYVNDVISDGDYLNGILGVSDNKTHLVKHTSDNNKYWWIWAYEKLVKGKITGTTTDYFKHVNSGYSDNLASPHQTALNQACDVAYKKNKQTIEETSTLLQEISSYCSNTHSPLTLPKVDNTLDKEPENVTTHTSTSTGSNTNYENKFLDLTKTDNKKYLVKSNENNTWWDWAFKKKYTEKKKDNELHTVFKRIDGGYGDANVNNKLNNACESSYQQIKSEYSFEDDKFLLKNIKDFCTKTVDGHDVSEPKVLLHKNKKTEADYKDGVLGLESNLNKLVQKTGSNNDLWWNWAFKNLINTETTKDADDTFKNLKKGYDANNDKSALNVACDNAYKKNKDDLLKNSKLLASVQKFCTPLKTNISLSLPKEPTVNAEPAKTTFEVANLDDVYNNQTILGNVKHSNRDKFVKPNLVNNTNWWRWSHQKNYSQVIKDKQDEVFKKITKGYSDQENDLTALNKACDAAYKKTTDEYKFEDGKYLWENITKFCVSSTSSTKDISEPHATVYSEVESTGTYSRGVLSVLENKNKIVKKDNNKLWWEWSYHYLVKGKTNSSNQIFKDVKSGVEGDKPLNNTCDAAYKKENKELATQSGQLLDDISQFCTIIKQKQALNLPQEFEPSNPKLLSIASDKDSYKRGVSKIDSNRNKLVDPAQSQEWWNWIFKNIYPGISSDRLKFPELFKNLSVGFSEVSDSRTKSLNKACKLAYTTDKEELEANQGNNPKIIDLIKKYCIPKGVDQGLVIPETPKEPQATHFLKNADSFSEKYQFSFAKSSINNEILVDPEKDKEWWEWMYDYNISKLNNNEKSKLYDVFVDLKLGFDDSNNKALNQACKSTYSKSQSSLNNKPLNSNKYTLLELAQKFCVPSSKQSTKLVNPS